MPETMFQFLTRVSLPSIEQAGLAFFGITEDSDNLGVQILFPGEQEPRVVWVPRSDVQSAIGCRSEAEVRRQIENALADVRKIARH